MNYNQYGGVHVSFGVLRAPRLTMTELIKAIGTGVVKTCAQRLFITAIENKFGISSICEQ
jgi:hypothetical protein